MPKISVIVPVYNTAPYLGICLSSLVQQTFKDFEIIIINDGSTDNSNKIISEYQKKYPHLIKYYSFDNQGISQTRNYGLKVAKGKYISFIDSDDYVDITFLEKMYEAIKKTHGDICVCDYVIVNDNNELKQYKISNFSPTSIKNQPNLLFKINPSPWNKLYKKSLFKNLKFEKIKYEDLLLIPKLLCRAQKIVKINASLNFYRIREQSETTTHDERIFDILKVIDKLNQYFKEEQLFDIYYQEIEYFNIYYLTMHNIRQRYQKDYQLKNKFIDTSFNYLNDNFPKWRHNKYYKKRNIFKKIIESSRILSKIYVNLYKR